MEGGIGGLNFTHSTKLRRKGKKEKKSFPLQFPMSRNTRSWDEMANRREIPRRHEKKNQKHQKVFLHATVQYMHTYRTVRAPFLILFPTPALRTKRYLPALTHALSFSLYTTVYRRWTKLAHVYEILSSSSSSSSYLPSSPKRPSRYIRPSLIQYSTPKRRSRTFFKGKREREAL